MMTITDMSGPGAAVRVKLLFWLLLGIYSTFFAEVASGSTLYAFTTAFGLLFVFPIYALHTVVLSTLVFRFGRPRFYTLYIAGALLGMYEAYMTKILWVSFLPTGPLFKLGGIGVIEVLVLVFFWHPLMAFILPLGLAERFLTSSHTIRVMGVKAKKFQWAGLGALLGANQALYSRSIFRSLTAGGLAFAVLYGATWLWRRKQLAYYTIESLLPRGGGLALLFFLLFVDYAVVSRSIRPDKFPGLVPQLSVCFLYAVLLLLFIAHLKRSRAAMSPISDSAEIPLAWLAVLLGTMTASSAIISAVLSHLPTFGAVVFPALLSVSALSGVCLLAAAIADLLKRSHIYGVRTPSVHSADSTRPLQG